MNKFEQVPSLGYQMSLAVGRPGGEGWVPVQWDPMSMESLYSEVPCLGGGGSVW